MNLRKIKGIGEKKEKVLNSLGIFTIEDLINYLPKRYEDRSALVNISDAVDSKKQFFIVEIKNSPKTYFYRKNASVTRLIAGDETADINIIWYNDRFTAQNLKPKNKYKIFGLYDAEKKAIINPIIAKIEDESIGSIVPIYSTVKGISSKEIVKYKDFVFSKNFKIQEYLDEKFLNKNNLLDINEMLKIMHKPENYIDLYNAYYSYNFRNLYIEKLTNKIYKEKINKNYIAFNDVDLNKYISQLKYSLTDSQNRALEEIKSDMKANMRMNRIIIGDVGSGKTIVAILSAIFAVKNNYQVAFMAPTEVLAYQHYKNYKEYLHNFGINCDLLTGSTKNPMRKEIYKNISEGKIDIIFGTHALFQDKINFKNLGLIITDEQQRFGVYQRKKLADKGQSPDILLLSATPIPRTLALSIYNTLDLSYIDELPNNRLPIKSYLVNIYQEKDFINFAFSQIMKKRQVYIVVSRVEDVDELESVEKLYQKLNKYFNNKIKIDILHGKMSSEEKELIQRKFSDGEIDLLISTTVIEVGIDVPNANTMIIYDAERFGLSQLHQLRGRVGRSNIQSYCFFVVNEKDKISEKLKFIKDELDGFEIAKKDLEIRGQGDLYGKNQSGFIEFDNSFLYNENLIKLVDELLENTDKISDELRKIINKKIKSLDEIILN